jgi:hypothetical protein
MANDALATYLNDHLAGSVVALELLEHLVSARAETPDAPLLASLRAEIDSDRADLERLMARLDIAESKPRQLTAWFTEKVAELKLHVDDPGHGALRRLETLETVSLGIEGKRELAHVLAAVARDMPALAGFDAAGMARRAEEQRATIEPLRLQAAIEAFAAND